MLTIGVSSPGWAFWQSNEYQLSTLQITGNVKDVSGAQATQNFILTEEEVEGLENCVKPEKYYGITYYPNDWETRGIFYMAAIEIVSPDIMHPSLVVKTIPRLQYARFIHKGSLKDHQLTFDYIYHTWLPKSGQSLACPLEIVCHGQDFRNPETEESEREIYVPIE